MKICLFSPFEWYLGGGERYLMKMAEVLARQPERKVTVIGSQPLAGSQYQQMVGLAPGVSFEYRPELASAKQRYRRQAFDTECDLFITLSNRFYPPIYPIGTRNWMILQFPMPSSGYKKLLAVLLGYLFTPRYEKILCYSNFTADWIKRRGLPFIKPAINIVAPPILAKYYRTDNKPRQNWILGVGRFFAGEHNKKQIELIKVFRQMVEQGLQGWELHLAGTFRNDLASQEYVRQVQALAQDFPIVLHLNSDENELLSLYQTARIFWHATGLDENSAKEPEKMEHFGMTTVEAMASGVVPVVINQGGQPEIVEAGVNGYTWQTTTQLTDYTMRLIEQPQLWQNLSKAAHQRSLIYTEDVFAERLEQLIGQP